jgi:hypothetical protein
VRFFSFFLPLSPSSSKSSSKLISTCPDQAEWRTPSAARTLKRPHVTANVCFVGGKILPHAAEFAHHTGHRAGT